MLSKREITRNDIVPSERYAAERGDRRRRVTALKRRRRVEVGPFATFYFENYETMLHQVQEMLFIEKGGEAQIPDELRAYNPLIPKGAELVATVMFEIEDPVRRATVLATLGGIEHVTFIEVGGVRILGIPEGDQERSTEEGKASSVQFIHFPFNRDQIAAFRAPGATVLLGFAHRNYGHMAVMPDEVRAELARDFDLD
ncbi:MAG: DUF3501 family protein [Alphaproteobacteria bacterium]